MKGVFVGQIPYCNVYGEDPAAETAGRLKLNICFQCHSRLSGILPTCSGSQERFWTSQNDIMAD